MMSQSRRRLHLCVESTFDVERGIFGCLVGSPSALARNHVGRVPAGPVVFRSGRLVRAMAFLCFLQKLCQRRDVQAESSSGKARLDLLKNPAIAVRIGE